MRGVMMRVSVAIGAIAVAFTAFAGPALAHDHGWKKKRWHHHDHYYVAPSRAYVIERPVVYAPVRPVYVEPMYYGPPPVPSLNINIPLR